MGPPSCYSNLTRFLVLISFHVRYINSAIDIPPASCCAASRPYRKTVLMPPFFLHTIDKPGVYMMVRLQASFETFHLWCVERQNWIVIIKKKKVRYVIFMSGPHLALFHTYQYRVNCPSDLKPSGFALSSVTNLSDIEGKYLSWLC